MEICRNVAISRPPKRSSFFWFCFVLLIPSLLALGNACYGVTERSRTSFAEVALLVPMFVMGDTAAESR